MAICQVCRWLMTSRQQEGVRLSSSPPPPVLEGRRLVRDEQVREGEEGSKRDDGAKISEAWYAGWYLSFSNHLSRWQGNLTPPRYHPLHETRIRSPVTSMSSIKVIRRLDVRPVIATKIPFFFFSFFSFLLPSAEFFDSFIYTRVRARSKRERRKLNSDEEVEEEWRLPARGFQRDCRKEDSRTDLPAIRLKVVELKYRVPRDVIVTLSKSGCFIQLNGKRLYFH